MAANDTQALDALFKKVYPDGLINATVTGIELKERAKWVAKSKELGDTYEQPVQLALPHAATFVAAGASGAPGLNPALASTLRKAVVQGSQIALTDELNYEVAAKAKGGRNAFRDATDHIITGLRESADIKLETVLFHGGKGLGLLSGATAGVLSIARSEFAVSVWGGAIGMPVQVYRAGTRVTVASSSYGNLQDVVFVTAIDSDARTVSVVKADGSAVAANTFAAGDVIYFAGAYGIEMKGLHSIIETRGNLWGIDNTVYDRWAGNVFDVADAANGFTKKGLTTSVINAAVQKAIAKGFRGEMTFFVSHESFADLTNVQEELRRYSAADAAAQTGFDDAIIRVSSGKVRLVPTGFVKPGYAYGVVEKDLVRIGAQDVSFNRPGQSDMFFMDLPTQMGYQLRVYTHQALFVERPAHTVLIKGLVSGDI